LRYGRWRKLLHCEMLVPKNEQIFQH